MADKNFRRDNKSFMVYKEWEELFTELDSPEDAGKLIMALFAYSSRGERPEFRGALKMAFIVMSSQLDRDGEKWEDICERNRSAANARWGKRSDADECGRIRAHTKNADKDKDKDKDKEKDKDTDTDKEEVEDKDAYADGSAKSPETTITTTTASEKYSNNDNEAFPPKPPTVSEVKSYCEERQNGLDAEYFCDYYASRGWLIGKSVMTDWRAAVRMWERKEKSPPVRAEEQRSCESSVNVSSDFDFDAYYAFAESYDPELILGQQP